MDFKSRQNIWYNFQKLHARFYLLCPLSHLIAVPAWAVRIRLLHLRIELATVGEVVNRLEGEGGLVPGEVQREIHYEEQNTTRDMERGKRIVWLTASAVMQANQTQ